MRKTPRHGIEEAHARDGDARIVPCVVGTFEDVHALIEQKLADEVGTPRSGDSYLGFGNAPSLSVLDNGLPACKLLFLRTVEVAASEYVAQVGVQEGTIFLDGQGRRELPGALVGPAIHQEGRVDDVRVRREPLQDLFDVGHLRRVSRADERADDDSRQSGITEGVQEANLVFDRDVGGLDLHPLAHRLVAVLDCGPLEVHGVSCQRTLKWFGGQYRGMVGRGGYIVSCTQLRMPNSSHYG